MVAPPVAAIGTFVSVPNRSDMAFDADRGIIYISAGSQLQRFDVESGSLLSPIELSGDLRGLDISPDGSTLAVADAVSSATELWVHLVDLDTLQVSTVPASKAWGEAGSHSVAYAYDGSLLVSSDYSGSGWVPMRRLDPTATQWSTTISSVRQRTMLATSGDRGSLAFAEANTSDGAWGVLDLLSGVIDRRSGYSNGTSWFNFEIGANVDGSQFAIPTYGGTMVYDASYQKIATIGQYAGPQPIGVAYHPAEPLVYFPWAGTGEVKVYDTAGLTEVASLDFEDSFQHTGNSAYRQGRTKLSGDGSLLMVTVTGGVRFERLYSPLVAHPVSATSSSGAEQQIPLDASVGNGGLVEYSIETQPQHGSVVIAGGTATYIADAGFSGTDSFVYGAAYGKETTSAVATVQVSSPNASPTANADFGYTRNRTISVDVLANDTDADGDLLSVIGVGRAARGHVALRDGVVIYTPPKGFHGSDWFEYTIDDGRGGRDSAIVTIIRN